jgi:hypothetical protein
VFLHFQMFWLRSIILDKQLQVVPEVRAVPVVPRVQEAQVDLEA